ncbi:unnamed protein product [Adineta steineri]|uniref:Kinesin light chain n=1 Tax=Adineta steineri TaxID=433720 RepID=A0A815QUM2_9BILA|nr:unnamed protein product [Adineta steineri]CAF1634989.1 unnamed protein product [Adineta steineri]
MVLCSEHEHKLETLFQHMKNEFDSGETNILVFSHLLRKMGKLDDAEKYYRRSLSTFSYDDSNKALCYHALGLVADDKGDYESSLICIAIIYQSKGNYNLALESYENVLTIWKEVFGEDHPHVAICLNNIKKALVIFQKHLPADHSDLASIYGSIGNIHLCLGHHNQALQYYDLSLKIYEKCHPSQHPDIAITLSNISSVYEDKNEYQQALVYLGRASDIYHDLLPSTHPNVIQLEQSIKRVSEKLK